MPEKKGPREAWRDFMAAYDRLANWQKAAFSIPVLALLLWGLCSVADRQLTDDAPADRARAQTGAAPTMAPTPTYDVLADRVQSQRVAATATAEAERKAAETAFREVAWPDVVRLYEKDQGDNPTNLYMDAVASLNQGDITGEDMLETVRATESFTTSCAVLFAWGHSGVGREDDEVFANMALSMVQKWPGLDGQDCIDDLDWSALTK